jgi:DNA repair exonuclease SbcCD nuclease subunit
MIKILHTADWHLRDTQYGNYERGLEFFAAAKRLVNDAILLHRQGKIDCIINGGDILDKKRPPSIVIHQLMEIHDMLVEAGIPMFTITGNHDQDDPSWISLNKKHNDRGIITIDDTTVDFKGVKIRGVLETSRKKIEEDLAQLTEQIDIIVWHGSMKECAGFDNGNYISLNEFIQYSEHLNTKLFLFGDIHKRQYFEQTRTNGNKIICGYPGSIEMASGVSEPPAKSCTIVDFDTLAMVEVPLITRPFIDADLSDPDVAANIIHQVLTTNEPLLINLKYYLDERFYLFDQFKSALNTREGKYNDIVRYSNEAPSTVVTNTERKSGTITLPELVADRLSGTSLVDVATELCLKTSNFEKVVEKFVQDKIPHIV